MTGTSVHGLYNACTMKTGVTICFYLFVFIIYTVTRTVIMYSIVDVLQWPPIHITVQFSLTAIQEFACLSAGSYSYVLLFK